MFENELAEIKIYAVKTYLAEPFYKNLKSEK